MNNYKVTVISLMRCKMFVMKFVLCHVMKEHGHDFKSVLMLQSSICLIKKEPDSDSRACVTTFDIGSEEGNIKFELSNIKFEESLDIKEENPEAITIPPIKPEPEVSVWGLCIRQQCFLLPRPFTATKREIMKIHFNYPYVCTVHFVQFIIQTNHCTTCILTINFCIVTLQVL